MASKSQGENLERTNLLLNSVTNFILNLNPNPDEIIFLLDGLQYLERDLDIYLKFDEKTLQKLTIIVEDFKLMGNNSDPYNIKVRWHKAIGKAS